MRQWMQIIKETAIGTTPVASGLNSIWIDMEESDPSINLTPSMYQIRSALPKRGVTNRLTGSGTDNISGSFNVGLYHEQVAFWKDAVFEPSLVSTVYPFLPTYTINRAWVDDGYVARVEQYKRCLFSACTITGSNADGGDPIRMDLTVIGGEYNSGATLTAPACSVFPTELYLWTGTDYELNDVSLKQYIRSLSLTITHSVAPVRHMNRYPDRYGYYGWNPAFAVEMDMFSHAYRTKYLDIRTSFASAIYATNNMLEFTYAADKKLTFNFFNAMFNQLDPQRPPGGDHTHSAGVIPYYDCTNLDMTCTVTNPA